jgi:xanthine dehydrogenase accessory factor
MEEIVEELIRIKQQGASAVLATVVDAGENGAVQAGDKCLVRDGQIKGGNIQHRELLKAVVAEAENRLREERSKLVSLETPGLKADVFFEVLPAPPRLYIVGAGHIAVPLAKIAKILEYHVTVLDDRVLFANRERFPDADEIQVGDMAETLKKLPIDSFTYIVLITRGHKYDEPCLREIIHSGARYIGMIGSKRRIKACFERFRAEEKIAEELIEKVHAPIGLDINSETPEEIALSILGEIIKVRRGGKAQSLSEKRGSRIED